MPLIKSISGIRGTIGGQAGDNLTPPDLLAFVRGFVQVIKSKSVKEKPLIVVGRDGRISGPALQQFINNTLLLLGVDVLDLALATTPTIAMAVINNEADGGIIISASHNPQEWNALKLLNNEGEYINAEENEELIHFSKELNLSYPGVNDLGELKVVNDALESHIEAIKALKLVNRDAIAKKNFKVVVDGINSVGALAVPELLKSLGVENIVLINEKINGEFAHNPEPLDEHLEQIKARVIEEKADLGIVVDPDVDRLAFIDEKGQMFGEEYTLVAIADYVLSNYCACFHQKISVSNLSSSRALKDITEAKGGSYYATAVGELNVVQKMKETGAAIGGEGNGGVIYPELHYGRDALVGIALFLSFLAQERESVSQIKQRYPQYEMIKDRIEIDKDLDLKILLDKVKEHYQGEKISDTDGIKVDWEDSWFHLRASNTEPIIRIYSEAKTKEKAEKKVKGVKDFLADIK
ncbi:MAG: phosphoglucosamine mutase [Clostridia bacterium]|nr:phosphoglucosamine mutase [Clostridia bacterium]